MPHKKGYYKDYYWKNHDKLLKYKRAYRKKHLKNANDETQRWREKNPQKIKDYSKKYYDKHKEVLLEKTQAWREENIEHIKQYSHKYYQTDKGKDVAAKTRNKRRRNFGFNKPFPNPFADSVTVIWHHINNNNVVAIPKDLHKYFNRFHRENMQYIVNQIYGVVV